MNALPLWLHTLGLFLDIKVGRKTAYLYLGTSEEGGELLAETGDGWKGGKWQVKHHIKIKRVHPRAQAVASKTENRVHGALELLGLCQVKELSYLCIIIDKVVINTLSGTNCLFKMSCFPAVCCTFSQFSGLLGGSSRQDLGQHAFIPHSRLTCRCTADSSWPGSCLGA